MHCPSLGSSLVSENGKIDIEEFQPTMSLIADADNEAIIREAFQVFDTDGSGSISAPELKHLMTNWGKRWTDEAVAEMTRKADIDADGLLDYEGG